jgi:hypothetical protein
MQKTSIFSDFYCLPNKLALMGPAPSNALPTWAKRLRPRARVLAHEVKAFEESVFGPCTLGRTWGTRPGKRASFVPPTAAACLDISFVLLNPQGLHRIQPGGAQGGQPYCQQRYCGQNYRDGYKYHRVPCLDAEKEAGDQAGEPEGGA